MILIMLLNLIPVMLGLMLKEDGLTNFSKIINEPLIILIMLLNLIPVMLGLTFTVVMSTKLSEIMSVPLRTIIEILNRTPKWQVPIIDEDMFISGKETLYKRKLNFRKVGSLIQPM